MRLGTRQRTRDSAGCHSLLLFITSFGWLLWVCCLMNIIIHMAQLEARGAYIIALCSREMEWARHPEVAWSKRVSATYSDPTSQNWWNLGIHDNYGMGFDHRISSMIKPHTIIIWHYRCFTNCVMQLQVAYRFFGSRHHHAFSSDTTFHLLVMEIDAFPARLAYSCVVCQLRREVAVFRCGWTERMIRWSEMHHKQWIHSLE